VADVIFLGGDTDTLAAMAGALAGAYLGTAGLPPRLVGLLENRSKGRDDLTALAGRLFDAYRAHAPAG
jgi:ADP-ribosylglycohydrolase